MDPLQHIQEQLDLIKIRSSSLNSYYLQTKDTYNSLLECIQEIQSNQSLYLQNSSLHSLCDHLHSCIEVLREFTHDLRNMKQLLSKEVYFEPGTD